MDDPDRLLPAAPPFRLRVRVLTPLTGGGHRYLDDGIVDVGPDGRIVRVAAPSDVPPVADVAPGPSAPLFDLRPWLLLPGLIDLHAHIPQLPNAGVGAGLDLLAWLERYTFPIEERFNAATAERLAPLAFRAFAAAGTTTVAGYVTRDAAATDAVFRAAESSGIRTILGLVLMDRLTTPTAGSAAGTDEGLRASRELCRRWDGRDRGRIRYAFTPRFALSCSAEVLRGSVQLAAEHGTYWQTHLAEDRREIAAVRDAFPDARDYLDVYERAGALDLAGAGAPRALFAHAIHLSHREIARLAGSGAAVAHCPASNLFLPSGIMPLARYLGDGVRVGLGSDVAAGPDPSLFEVMRVGAYAQHALLALGNRPGIRPAGPATGWEPAGEAASHDPGTPLDPIALLRLGTFEGARALGIEDAVGSVEAGKEADVIVVDPSIVDPIPGAGVDDAPADIISRLIFRTQRGMVRAAWVRGRRI
jgi:guanine deaminase